MRRAPSRLLDFWPEPGQCVLRLACGGKVPGSQGHYVEIESVLLRERRPGLTDMALDQDMDWRKQAKLYD